jgi:hypothetical protein
MDYAKLADKESVDKTVNSLKEKGYVVDVVPDGKSALDKIKVLIPKGASIMNGSSVTLETIGYQDYLESGEHGWIDLHVKVMAEDDKEKRSKLRKEATISDYYLGSVHGLAETGEFVVASNTGSQLPHIVYNSQNLVFVVSTKKIVPTLEATIKRLEEYVVPLEEKHMMEKYKMHTGLNKELIFRGEAGFSGRKIYFILVEEDLGF